MNYCVYIDFPRDLLVPYYEYAACAYHYLSCHIVTSRITTKSSSSNSSSNSSSSTLLINRVLLSLRKQLMIQSQEQHFFPTRRRYVFFGEPGRMPINRNPHIEITHYILLSPRNESGTQSVILPATSVHRFDCEDITSMEPETSSLYIECRLVTGVNGNPMIVFGWLLIPSVVPTVHIISPFNRTCCSHSSGTVWT